VHKFTQIVKISVKLKTASLTKTSLINSLQYNDEPTDC